MNDVTPSTAEEKRMIEGIQKSYGALANGIIGNQTLSEIAKDKCPEIFPLTLSLYGMPTIIGKDILLFDPGGGLAKYKNSLGRSLNKHKVSQYAEALKNRLERKIGPRFFVEISTFWR